MKKLLKKIFSALGRFFAEFWRELALSVTGTCFVVLTYEFTYYRPENRFTQSFMLVGMAALAAASIWLLRLLWKKKWKKSATARLQKVFARLQKWVDGVANKLGLSNRQKKSVLEGKTKIIFESGAERESKREKAEYKPPRWSKLRNNRDRVRYLYREMATEKIRRGERIYCFDTPSELLEKEEKGSVEERLIDLYVTCRYDERKDPEAKTVADIKRDIGQ